MISGVSGALPMGLLLGILIALMAVAGVGYYAVTGVAALLRRAGLVRQGERDGCDDDAR